MKEGLIDCVIVGADRIALTEILQTKSELIPLLFWQRKTIFRSMLPLPTTTIDFSIETGEQIPIEERSPAEITHIKASELLPKV